MKLNLGCGYRKLDGFVNIDNRPEVEPDRLLDITAPLPFLAGEVDEVRAHDILEHIPIGKVVPLIEEIYRVLKPGGRFESSTPDAEFGQAAFQDPYHVSFWVENSWLYFSSKPYRDLYGIKANFIIESMHRRELPGRIFHLNVVAIKNE